MTDKWTLVINTSADVERNVLLLNGKPLPVTSVNLEAVEGEIPQLIVEIPILDDNLEIKIDKVKPTDIEVVKAETVKDK